MIVSATSALVLNWTLKGLYKSNQAQDYFDHLNLSAADPLFQKFDDEENFMQTQLVSNRKFFVRKCAVEFLEKCNRENVPGQAIILAAGLDPLTIELCSLYPECIVFDIDKYPRREKEEYVKKVCRNVNFIDCDITMIELLKDRLLENGWNSHQPSMLIMEGISYYITESDLRNVFSTFAAVGSALVNDFGLLPGCVDEINRRHGKKVYQLIKEAIGMESLHLYEPDYYISLVRQCGFANAGRFKMGEIQLERTGERSPFNGEEPGWVSMITN